MNVGNDQNRPPGFEQRRFHEQTRKGGLVRLRLNDNAEIEPPRDARQRSRRMRDRRVDLARLAGNPSKTRGLLEFLHRGLRDHHILIALRLDDCGGSVHTHHHWQQRLVNEGDAGEMRLEPGSRRDRKMDDGIR